MKIDVTAIQYHLAPFSAPIPTAIAVGASLNYALLSIPGINPGLALLGGIGGGIATEVSGGLMFSMAARAFFSRKWGALIVALLGSGLYIGVIAWSASVGQKSAPIIGAAIVSGLVYVAIALYQYFRDLEKKTETDLVQAAQAAQEDLARQQTLVEIERKRAETQQMILNAEAERIRQEKLLENARARANRTVEQKHFVRRISRTNEQTLRPDWLEKTRQLLAQNKDATTRDVAANLGAKSSSTGKAYRDAALSEEPKG